MKNKFKLALMVVLSMVVLTGCGDKSPSDVVNSYFSEVKSGKNLEISNYILNSTKKGENTEENKDVKQDPKIEEAMKIYTQSLNVKTLSEDIKEDKASVEVELTGINVSNIMMSLMKESIASAFSGKEVTEEQMNNSILEKVKGAKLETRKGKINLTKVENEWKIESQDEAFLTLVFGEAKELANAFSSK